MTELLEWFFKCLNLYFIAMMAFMIAFTLDSAVPSKAIWVTLLESGSLVVGIVFILAIITNYFLSK